MLVDIKYTEVLAYEVEKTVEMSAAEYKKYLKDGVISKDLEHDLSNECGDDKFVGHWIQPIILISLKR